MGCHTEITRNVCETCLPISLNITVTLTFDIETPSSMGSSTSHDQQPYQVRISLGMGSLVSDRTRFVYGPTDRPTDRPTYQNVQSKIPPLLRRGT